MYRSRTIRALVAGAALAALLTASACGSDDGQDGSDAAQEPSVTVYSGRSENLIKPLIDRFTDETGIDVEVRYGDSADLALLIAEEGDRSPADVFLSQSPGAIGFLARQDLLAKLPGDILNRVPEAFRSEGGWWVGVSGRQRVVAYNTELVQPAELPKSIDDVADARFKGKVGVAPQNSSFQDFVTAMREARGDEATLAWLTKLAGNEAMTYPKNDAIVAAVGRGEVPLGLVNHYYALRFLDEDPDLPVRNHAFAEGDIGSIVIVSSASILRSAQAPEGARRLLEFLLSADSQRYFGEETFEYPLVTGVVPPEQVSPLDTQRLPPGGLDDLGGGLERTAELIRESGLDR